MTKQIVLFLYLLLSVAAARAIPTRLYDAEVLSSNRITSLCQDSQGYIWVGTEYGLNKFDGGHFTQYYSDDANPQSLADDIVRRLLIGSDGTLWIVTNRGVQRYSRLSDSFETVAFGESLAANINDILETPSGKVWLLSAADGVYEVDAAVMEAHPVEAVNRRLALHSEADNMYLDSKGRLWVSDRDEGLQMVDTRSDRCRSYGRDALGDLCAADIIEDAHRRLTIVTYSAVLQLNEQSGAFETLATFPRCAVQQLYRDSSGRLLISTSGNGLLEVVYEAGRQGVVNAFDRLHVSRLTDGAPTEQLKVHAYLEDHSGNLWIGCMQRGLLLVSTRPSPFRFLPLSRMQNDNGHVLRSVFADSEGHVFVCQEKGGITSIDREGKTLSHWMDDHTVMTLLEAADGTFWAGTYRNGLFRIDPRTGSGEWQPHTGTQRIGSITTDRDGNLYTAVFTDGLHSYTPDGKTERPLCGGTPELMNPYLNVLYTDSHGRIWIGHYFGIDVYDPATDALVDVGIPATLRPAIVYAISESAQANAVWVGSDKGLFRYTIDGDSVGQWRRFTTADGLPNNNVSSLVITRDGTLWCGTYRGLAQLTPDGKFTRYYHGNGLEEWSYLRGVYAHKPDDEVVLGNQNGITSFMPDEIVKDSFQLGITLTGMRLGNVWVNATTLSNGRHIVSCPLEETRDITVSYLDNTFSLLFSSMDFRDAQNVHYEFRFANETGSQWYHTESGRSEIFFSHLAVGTHRLVVRAYDNGVYSPEKVITIYVTPPWYRSWGAYVFLIAFLLAIVVQLWRSFWARRKAEINEERIRFFVDISHELRSPLTLIKSPIDKLLRTASDPTQTRALRNIERNTDRLLTLVNQILSIRKIEKGQMTLHCSATRLGDFVEDICHDYDYQTEKRQISLRFINEAPEMVVAIDRDHFDKVVTNLIGNALKYVEDGGEIDVIVRRTKKDLAELCVRDNGPGIDEAQLKKIFERFYQASARPVAGQMSYGIGLNLSQKIVMLHKGIIIARNRDDGNGSEFVVKLPVQSGAALTPDPAQGEGGDAANASNATPVSLRSGAGGAAASGAAASGDASPRRRRKTTYHIAVVDDDAELCEFLQTELGETYHVHTYADGRQALEGIAELLPDLVVTDVVMPQMDGIELMKRLKSSTKTSHIPIILLTTKTEHQARISGLEQGADAYIDKPFNLEELEARIAGLIANRIRLRGKFSGIQEQEDTVRKVELKGNDAALMEKIMKAVNERLDDSDFNVEALAATVGLSRVQLHRRMKEMTGITVGEFIRNLRLQQAAKLLEKGDTTVSQVTYAVGFATPTHFTAAFKKHFGVTPSDYMAKAQARRKQ